MPILAAGTVKHNAISANPDGLQRRLRHALRSTGKIERCGDRILIEISYVRPQDSSANGGDSGLQSKPSTRVKSPPKRKDMTMDVMAIGRAIETLPLPPSLIVVSPDALHDLERKYHDLSFEILVTKYRGVQLVKDPGLHEGTIEIIADAEVARRRLHLISLGLTVTADGLIKSSR